MKLNEYQKLASKTDYNNGKSILEITDIRFINKLLGLSGESGEVAEKFKKIYRNNEGKMSEEERLEIIKELGDVLWYISAIARHLKAPLEQVAKTNLKKLKDRAKRNVILSSGDNR